MSSFGAIGVDQNCSDVEWVTEECGAAKQYIFKNWGWFQQYMILEEISDSDNSYRIIPCAFR